MAIKKTQMYRKNLDTSETNLYPLTESQYVLMENGQTVQEVLSDRDSDKYTPVITNSSSTFKVGQGDNVDLSSSMKEGAYDSCVLKGKSMVNCIQEPSSQDVVLPYEFEDGQYVTINDTKESGALGVELKGQTLVNQAPQRNYWFSRQNSGWYEDVVETTNEVGFTITGEDAGWRYLGAGYVNRDTLKPNTKYLIVCEEALNISKVVLMAGNATGRLSDETNLVNNRAIITTYGELTDLTGQIFYFYIKHAVGNKVKLKNVMFIEYQEGMENWDIPYFTGMTSVKLPILKTTGKNLLPSIKNTWYPCRFKQGTTFKLSTRDSVPSNGGNVVFKDINGTSVWFGIDSGNTTSTKVLPCDVYYIMNSLATDVEHQLEIGTQVTSYEPNKTSILSLPEEVVLRSLPNGVRDTFNTRTGVYTRYIEEVVLNGADPITSLMTSVSDVNTTTSRCYLDYGNIPDNIAMKRYSSANTASDKIICDLLPTLSVLPDIQTTDIESIGQTTAGFSIRVRGKSITECKQRLAERPVTILYERQVPIVTKINLSSTLKSWNTTTHIHSEIPENTLYPILSHSNPTYPVILKPSTKYSIVANSYSNNHTNSAINFNLGGATASTTVGNRVTTITTPSTLSNELLTMSGRGNKLNNVMVIEGDVAGDESYFEGICDCKSPILSNVGENLFDVDGEFVKGAYSYGVPVLSSSNQVIEKIGENSLHITCGTNFYHSGWGQIIDVKNLDSVTISVMSTFSNSLTNPELKVLCLYESEEVPTTMDGQKKTDYDNRYLTQTLNDTNKTYTRTINTRGFAKVYVLFTGGYKAGGQGTFDFTLHNIYVGEESTYHGYESYKSNATTFDQKDDKTIVLRSLPNGVCDTLNVETGEYIQRIGELTFNGSKAEWRVMPYPPQEDGTHYQFQYWLGDNLIGGDLWNNSNAILADTLPTADGTLHWGGKSRYGIGGDRSNFMITWEKSSCPFYDVPTLNAWLGQNPITVQYQLATPVVKTVDVQGFPYAYINGHVQLSSGSIEQSLTPTVEYSLSANKTGQIDNNTRQVVRQQNKLDDFEAMMLTAMVQSAYDKAILQFDYEMRMMSLGGE